MRKERVVAIQLRKEGKSYREIDRLLNVPIRTLFYWFKGLNFIKNWRYKIVLIINNKRRMSSKRGIERDSIKSKDKSFCFSVK